MINKNPLDDESPYYKLIEIIDNEVDSLLEDNVFQFGLRVTLSQGEDGGKLSLINRLNEVEENLTKLKGMVACTISEFIDAIYYKKFKLTTHQTLIFDPQILINFFENTIHEEDLNLLKLETNISLAQFVNKSKYNNALLYDFAKGLALVNEYYIYNDLMDRFGFSRNVEKINSAKNIKWHISQTELIELAKALIENGNVVGVQQEIIEYFSSVFDIEIAYPNKLITDIKNRNSGSETLFIDKLRTSLFNYLTKENRR
ncbi:RteC domain-containing protein [Arenibacter sp. BSSL-BM3]|uniref:RteC domain-containing protein n=1 Tax=Arenibacter arenosicollis TaxID=2762274 RepID=A0ABR7QJR0_9FLAO|nr:RteC domain-containing protein [Arenibacter arenosicollis]MBC8767175.1 RteC domain-containing protein [Arenibacter arenosicollis]